MWLAIHIVWKTAQGEDPCALVGSLFINDHFNWLMAKHVHKSSNEFGEVRSMWGPSWSASASNWSRFWWKCWLVKHPLCGHYTHESEFACSPCTLKHPSIPLAALAEENTVAAYKKHDQELPQSDEESDFSDDEDVQIFKVRLWTGALWWTKVSWKVLGLCRGGIQRSNAKCPSQSI